MGRYIQTKSNFNKARDVAVMTCGKIVGYEDARAAMDDETKG